MVRQSWRNDTSEPSRVARLPVTFSSTYDLERLKGKLQSFRCKIVGNKWYHSGTLSNGGTIDEEWERVVKDQ